MKKESKVKRVCVVDWISRIAKKGDDDGTFDCVTLIEVEVEVEVALVLQIAGCRKGTEGVRDEEIEEKLERSRMKQCSSQDLQCKTWGIFFVFLIVPHFPCYIQKEVVARVSILEWRRSFERILIRSYGVCIMAQILIN